MTTYATYSDLALKYLPQISGGEQADEELLNDILIRSQSIVDGELGFTFAGYAAAAAKKVKAKPSVRFRMPFHESGSITAVVDGYGNAVDTSYWFEHPETGSLIAMYSGAEGRWVEGWYDVTAKWGYGDAPPAVVEVVLELAVHIWQGRMSGQFSNVVGVQGGGAVGYEGALTPRQKLALKNVKDAIFKVTV